MRLSSVKLGVIGAAAAAFTLCAGASAQADHGYSGRGGAGHAPAARGPVSHGPVGHGPVARGPARWSPTGRGLGYRGHIGYGVHLGPGVYRGSPYYRGYYGVGYPGYYAEPGYAGYYGPPPGYAGPPPPLAYAPREAPIMYGLGVSASALSVGHDGPNADGLGLVFRMRGRNLEGELELGESKFNNDARNDTHFGAALIVPLFGRELRPFLTIGAGVNVVRFADTTEDLTQGYLMAGGGLDLRIGHRFDITADVRGYARQYTDDAAKVSAMVPATFDNTDDLRREDAVEARLTGIVYF